jgi:predicted GH43/DUF377 family glycosyl hydrolase
MIEHLHRVAAHAYHCGEMDVGRRCCERLLRLPLSPEREERVRANRTWYTQTLADQGVAAEFTQIDVPPARVGWSLFNPSVVSHAGRLLVNVRSSNYSIDENGRYVIPPEDGETIRTFNCLVDGDASHYWAADYNSSEFAVEGLEDVRINSVDGELIASATIRNWAGHDGTCRIGVGRLERFDAISDIRCHKTTDGRHEKNWMPITGRREWLYHCHHQGRTCLVREDGDDWTVTAHADAPPVARGFRGGSQLVPLPDGQRWIAIVHEVAADTRRVYEHRVVELDEKQDWRITRVSPPFTFRESRSIEFCAGLAFAPDGDLVASFGVRDAEAWLVRFADWGDWDSWLEDAWE